MTSETNSDANGATLTLAYTATKIIMTNEYPRPELNHVREYTLNSNGNTVSLAVKSGNETFSRSSLSYLEDHMSIQETSTIMRTQNVPNPGEEPIEYEFESLCNYTYKWAKDNLVGIETITVDEAYGTTPEYTSEDTCKITYTTNKNNYNLNFSYFDGNAMIISASAISEPFPFFGKHSINLIDTITEEYFGDFSEGNPKDPNDKSKYVNM